MWKRSFGARLPSKSESWRRETEALVRDFPQKSGSGRCEYEALKRDFPPKSGSGIRCENEALVRDSLQNLKEIWHPLPSVTQKFDLPNGTSICDSGDSGDIVIFVSFWKWWYCDSGDSSGEYNL